MLGLHQSGRTPLTDLELFLHSLIRKDSVETNLSVVSGHDPTINILLLRSAVTQR